MRTLYIIQQLKINYIKLFPSVQQERKKEQKT